MLRFDPSLACRAVPTPPLTTSPRADMGFFFKDEQEKLLVLSLLDSDGSGTIR